MRGAAMTSLSRREPNQSSRKRRNQPGKHRGPDRRRPGTRSRPAPWGTPSTCGHSKHEPKQGNRHYTQTHPPPPQSQTHPDGGDKQTGLKKRTFGTGYSPGEAAAEGGVPAAVRPREALQHHGAPSGVL